MEFPPFAFLIMRDVDIRAMSCRQAARTCSKELVSVDEEPDGVGSTHDDHHICCTTRVKALGGSRIHISSFCSFQFLFSFFFQPLYFRDCLEPAVSKKERKKADMRGSTVLGTMSCVVSTIT